MSSSDRRSVLFLLAAAPLAACGFTPAYGTGGPARGLLNKVLADDPTDKNAFDLVRRLEERLGRPQAASYRLSYKIATGSRGIGITPDNATTRYNIDGTVTYTLRATNGDAVLTEGKATTFVSYSASGSTVSTDAAERDAYERLMRLLADQIVTQLVASSGRWGAK